MGTIIVIVLTVGVFWLMSRSARKAQQKQADQRSAAVVLGNNVVTQAGFFGRIVDIDGDAVTLESPSGDETVWLKSSIVAAMDIPLATDDDEEAAAIDADADSLESEGEPEGDPYAGQEDEGDHLTEEK